MNQPRSTVFRLTALWALCESGLGGWMHALGLPFTGFFVGGFAVIIIGLLAWYSRNNMKTVLHATLLVILVKLAVSPQSPPPAYIAVAFQGALGALLFRIIPFFRLAAILFGTVAMLESALQKLITATVIFGQSLWDAVDNFFSSLLKDLHLPADTPYSLWIIYLYMFIYAAWGVILGIWVSNLPVGIEAQKDKVTRELSELPPDSGEIPAVSKRDRLGTFFLVSGILAFIMYFLEQTTNGDNKALSLLVRALFIMAFFSYLVYPNLIKFLKLLLDKPGKRRFAQMKDIMALLPELKSSIRLAVAISKKRRGIFRFSRFVFILVLLTIHPELAKR